MYLCRTAAGAFGTEHDSRAGETHNMIKAIRKGALQSEIFAGGGEKVLPRTSEYTLLVPKIVVSVEIVGLNKLFAHDSH
jgi:hypothetical protein